MTRTSGQTVWQRIGGEIARRDLDGTERETVLGGGIEGFDCCPGPHIAVSDTHVYWARGQTIARARQDGRRAKHRFIALDLPLEHYVDGLAVDKLPFTFGELKRDRRHGTARLAVDVPGPGKLAPAGTKKIKGAKKRPDVGGSVKLPVRPKRKAKRRLNKTGHLKVKANVTYTPEGGKSKTRSNELKLKS